MEQPFWNNISFLEKAVWKLKIMFTEHLSCKTKLISRIGFLKTNYYTS